jgi:hypothetical protein
MAPDLETHEGAFLVNVRLSACQPVERAIFRVEGASTPRLASRREAPTQFARIDMRVADDPFPGPRRFWIPNEPEDPFDPPTAA